MAGISEPVPGDDETTITPTNSGEGQDSSEIGRDYQENHVNGIYDGSAVDNDKDQELLELIRDTGGRRGLMAGMPSINLNELTVILRDPSMPSHKIMNEVADKIMLRSLECKSDDGSVGSSGGVVGMKWLLDRIFEEAYEQTNSNNSDDEDDDCFERIPLEIRCNFCDKVFDSTMTSTTHVLVAHQHPSVLNISRLANGDDTKEKTHVPSRKHSKASPKSEAGDTQTCHAPKESNTQTAEHGEETALSGKRQASDSRSQQHSEPSDKHRSPQEQVGGVALLQGKAGDAASRGPTGLNEDAAVSDCERTIVESADQCVANDPTQLQDSDSEDIGSTEGEKRVEPSSSCRADSEDIGSTEGEKRVEPSSSCRADLLDFQRGPLEDPSSQVIGSKKGERQEDSSSSAQSLTKEHKVGVDLVKGKKRTASLLSEPSSPSSPSSSLNPKRSKKQAAKESDSRSTEEHDL